MVRSLQEKCRMYSRVYPVCRRLMPDGLWQDIIGASDSLERCADILDTVAGKSHLPEYLGETARLELFRFRLASESKPPEPFAARPTLNPTLELFENSWRNLAFLLAEDQDTGPEPERGAERVIVWRRPVDGGIRIKPAADEDLLVMKMALEDISIYDAAEQGAVSAARVEAALIQALDEGTVVGPEPLLKRHFTPGDYRNIDPAFFAARIFTLQWHITQACDLHCRHCYDRKQYKTLPLEQEIAILDGLAAFCSDKRVHGQVTFTGGNPLLHPNFENLYREAAERGFTTAILGNPTSGEVLERLMAIQPPAFYQVSLEGLPEHNDFIRGPGHFNRVLKFLDLLRDFDIYSMVMLTLTRDNMDQVLPLSEILDRKTDNFTFNRLSLVGEGANLAAADIGKFPEFLQSYLEAAGSSAGLGTKDNLFNILHHSDEKPVLGGCTGYGCGAAFNFITVLADGSVHACRKFPSKLGNILDNTLTDIYHSEIAERYRQGAAACRDCAIRPVCGGCLAVAHSHGLDVFREKDPYCFIDSQNQPG